MWNVLIIGTCFRHFNAAVKSGNNHRYEFPPIGIATVRWRLAPFGYCTQNHAIATFCMHGAHVSTHVQNQPLRLISMAVHSSGASNVSISQKGVNLQKRQTELPSRTDVQVFIMIGLGNLCASRSPGSLEIEQLIRFQNSN